MTGLGRAVVLGATGLVGSALVGQLLDEGWEVTATVRDAAAPARVADALQGVRLVTLLDGLDGVALSSMLRDSRPDVVVNCISTNPISGNAAARAYGDGNVTATAVTLDACVRSGVGRAIVFGSGFEYAPTRLPLDENSPIGPTTLYGATKAAAHLIAAYFRGIASLDVCVARPFSLYGPRERPTRFVPYVITSALGGRPIEMSTGKQTRDYLYVGDLADGLVRLAGHEGPLPETINFAGPEEHPLLDLVTIAVELAGSSAPIRVGVRPENPGDRPVFLGDSQLAQSLLGWRPKHDLRAGLAKTVELVRSASIPLGVMGVTTDRAVDLRRRILELVAEYHAEAFPEREFIAGLTPIPVSGKVFDEQELQHLVDASLDFWLTTGRFAERFEREFARWMGVRHAILVNSGSSANLLGDRGPDRARAREACAETGRRGDHRRCRLPNDRQPDHPERARPGLRRRRRSRPTTRTQVRSRRRSGREPERSCSPIHSGTRSTLTACARSLTSMASGSSRTPAMPSGRRGSGRKVGTFGDLATVSFYPAHHITMGEGGAVLTRSAKLKQIVESFRDWGRDCWCEPGKDNTCGKRFDWQLGIAAARLRPQVQLQSDRLQPQAHGHAGGRWRRAAAEARWLRGAASRELRVSAGGARTPLGSADPSRGDPWQRPELVRVPDLRPGGNSASRATS